ncbi:MAG: GNAT family N-acetyltransferase [Alphaproteobacteria bacterium]|nr:GNAT family N-acetyltransferase [Alphaproteobacteria bacterium]
MGNEHIYCVRPAQSQDIPRLIEIMLAGWKENYQNTIPSEKWETFNPDETIQKWTSYIEDANCPKRIYVLANHAGTGSLLGFFMFSPHETIPACFEINAIYVAPEYRKANNRYFGVMMMQELANMVANPELSITLMSEVCQGNLSAHRFFQSLGGQITHQTQRNFLGSLVPNDVFVWTSMSLLQEKISDRLRFGSYENVTGGGLTPNTP